MTFDQSDDEVRAQIHGEAAAIVGTWIGAVFNDGEWDQAMLAMTPRGREEYVRAWDGNLPEADVERLVAVDTSHPLWDQFAQEVLADHVDAFGDLPDNFAIASRPRAHDIDTELILLVDYRNVPAPVTQLAGGEARVLSGTTHPPAIQFEVSFASGAALIEAWHPGPDFPGQ